MTERVRVTLARGDRLDRLKATVEVLDPALHGHDAQLRLERHVVVQDSRPVNGTDVVATAPVKLGPGTHEVVLTSTAPFVYGYTGPHVHIEVRTRLVVDDGWLWDTKIDDAHALGLGLFDLPATDAKALMDPADLVDVLAALRTVPAADRNATVAVVGVASLVVVALLVVAVHDTFAEPWVWFPGMGPFPIVLSLVAAVLIGAAAYAIGRQRLRGYASLGLADVGRIGPTTVVPLARLITGQAVVPVEGARLRIVACNLECGQYRRGSGTDVRTVSFQEPVRGVLLYDRQLDRLAPGVPLGEAFGGDVDFGPVFFGTMPPQAIGSSHGVRVRWEVQLLHDQLVDHEVEGDADVFDYRALHGG